jgi:hypothetical protein
LIVAQMIFPAAMDVRTVMLGMLIWLPTDKPVSFGDLGWTLPQFWDEQFAIPSSHGQLVGVRGHFRQ